MTMNKSQETITEGLTAAIDRLYKVFARYEVVGMVEGCACCVSEADKLRLHSKPLQQLSAGDLERYAWKAMTTWGETEDFKHFLPRLLELLATGCRFDLDADTVVGKILYADWKDWPEEEREAVVRFLRAWWRIAIRRAPDDSELFDANDCLGFIGMLMDDMNPFLQDWSAFEEPVALYQLTRFLDSNADGLMSSRRFIDYYWKKDSCQLAQVISWLLDPQRKEALERAFFEDKSGPYAEEFSRAVEQIEGIKYAFGLG